MGGSIGLLADMDGLDIFEYTGVAYASKVPGKRYVDMPPDCATR